MIVTSMVNEPVGYDEHVSKLAYVNGAPMCVATLKSTPATFIVREELSFEPSGEGEHVYLCIQKEGLNTDDVAQRLAKFAGVPRRAVAYAGMKDRQAQTRQWFSVHLPGKSGPDWRELESDQLSIIEETRHLRKLKTGAIKSNRFEITLENVSGDLDDLQRRIDDISSSGVPNYFMQQRFGYQSNNLYLAERVFSNKEIIRSRRTKGLVLSAVRSYLFNQLLSKRVADSTWNKALQGEAFILNGTRQFFSDQAITEDIVMRVKSSDIHPSGPLYGKGQLVTKQEALALEADVMAGQPVFTSGLIEYGLENSRRALRVMPYQFESSWRDEKTIQLCFQLHSGSYATAVIRQLLRTDVS